MSGRFIDVTSNLRPIRYGMKLKNVVSFNTAALCRPSSERVRSYTSTAALAASSSPNPHPYAPHSRPLQEASIASDITNRGRTEQSRGAGSKVSYRSKARRILAAMVAAPIAIVTSYELFQRLFMGKERESLKIVPKDNNTDL